MASEDIIQMSIENFVPIKSPSTCASNRADNDVKYEEKDYIEQNLSEGEFIGHIEDYQNLNEESILPHSDLPPFSDQNQGLTESKQMSVLAKEKIRKNLGVFQSSIKKRLRQSSKTYVSANKKDVPVKTLKPPCKNCDFDCANSFTAEDRMNIFQSFWSMTDHRKNSFYLKFVKRNTVKRRKKESDESLKKYSFKYFFEKNESMHRVCRTFFVNTLCIDQKRIYYCFANLKNQVLDTKLPKKRRKYIKRVTATKKLLKTSETVASPVRCRCCENPSQSFLELESPVESVVGLKKTYKELLYEIIQLRIPPEDDEILPQKICNKCVNQLKKSYDFIRQACEISEKYLQYNLQLRKDETKSGEHLQDTLMELPDIRLADESIETIKIEALEIEYIPEAAINIEELQINNITDESQHSEEERDFLENSLSNSFDDSSNVESTSKVEMEVEVSDKSIARSCDICQKIFINESYLRAHKRYIHMPEEEKLPCPLCSYKASKTSAIKVHMGLMHGADTFNEYFISGKKYPCSLCSRSYGHIYTLRQHIRKKHQNNSPEEKPHKKPTPPKPKEKQLYLCTYCGKSYNSRNGLKSHLLSHSEDRPYSCDICSKTFKSAKILKVHYVVHSDEKPHQCSECGKSFKRVEKLKIHMRVHSELRPYKCNECDMTFKYSYTLESHRRIHTGETPFPCKTCGQEFSFRSSLNKHCLKYGHVK